MDKIDKLKEAIRATKKQGMPVLPKSPPALEEKQIAYLERELFHSYSAAYITSPREVFLADSFYDKAKQVLGHPIELPPKSIVQAASSVKLYAHLLWSMPETIDYLRDENSPRLGLHGLVKSPSMGDDDKQEVSSSE